MEETVIKAAMKLLKMIRLLLGFFLIYLLCLFIKKFSICQIFLQILQAFLPLLFGFLIAYLLEPLVKKLEKKLPRFLAVFLPFLCLFLILLLFFLFIIPPLIKEGSKFLLHFPQFLKSWKTVLSDLSFFQKNILIKEKVFLLLDEIPIQLKSFLEDVLPFICHSCLFSCITFFFSILLSIYLLIDFPKIKKALLQMIPLSYQKDVKKLFLKLRKTLLHYFGGVLLIMFFVFVTQAIGFSLAGLKTPLFFASLCAITDFIPFIGPYIGGIPSIIVAFSMSNQVGILTLLSIFVVQMLENTFYQPYILGKTLLLPSWLILITISVFSTFLGFLGLVVATPTLVVLKVVCPYLRKWLREKNVKDCLENK